MNEDGEGPPQRFERRSIGEAQRSGRVLTVPLPVRWVAYKPSSQQFKSGIKGRWQVCDDYGWRNSDFTPTEYLHNVDWPETPS